MKYKLNINQLDFNNKFADLLRIRESEEQSVFAVVKEIIDNVKKNGDEAVKEYTKKFDKLELNAIAISREKIKEYANKCDKEVRKALELAAKRIKSYHEKQLPNNLFYKDEAGINLGWKWSAISDVGIYVPGGKASYPSSVLMNAIPARVAGVERLVMVVPTPKGEINPAIFAAAEIAGITEIYPIGGAQAIAALAYGTQSIKPVHKIVGPGNAYVAEAKRQVFGKVGIDMIAGPSEILVVADSDNDSQSIAYDLLSQAEHDEMAQAILITDDSSFADEVEKKILESLPNLNRYEIASASWNNYGAIIVVNNLQTQAVKLINDIAPEHLELAVNDFDKIAMKVMNAGAIFFGHRTPEAVGDYVAGPSHVLPTSQTAKFSSGLSVLDFMKRTSLIGCTRDTVDEIYKAAEILAKCEGLQAHGMSAGCRI